MIRLGQTGDMLEDGRAIWLTDIEGLSMATYVSYMLDATRCFVRHETM